MIPENRFKELVHLYLDHEITPAEARELESAVQADPRRARILREYQTLHQGCARLFATTAAGAPPSPTLRAALQAAESRMAGAPAASGTLMRLSWMFGGAGALAAAAALVVTLRSPTPGLAPANLAESEPRPSVRLGGGGYAVATPQPAPATVPILASYTPPAPATAQRYTHLTFAGVGIDEPVTRHATWAHTTIALDTDEVTEITPVYTAQWLEREATSGPATFGHRPVARGGWTSGAMAVGFQSEFSAFEPAATGR